MAERSLRFDLVARDKSFSRVLDQAGRKGQRLNREFTRTLGQTGDRAGREFGVRLNKRLGAGLSASARVARVGAGAIGAGLAVAGLAQFATDSVQLAATFDKTMRQVAVATKTPTSRIDELRKVALKMGATTSFSARDASEAMLALGKGGLSFAEQKAGALSATLTLAAAGGLELGDSADYVVQGLRAFGLRADKAATVAAALAGAANASTSNVEDMGLALSQTAAGARNAGLSIEETTGVLAAFANNGIRGSDAGTSLKTMLTRLVPTTEKARDKMAELGLKFTDAHGAILPITEIAGRLQDKLGGLSDAQRTAALATIFGSDATRAATILMREGEDGLAKYIKATSDRTAAEDLARTNTEGAAGAFERLQGAIETVQIIIGDAFLPKLADAAEWLAEKLPAALDTLQDGLKSARDWWSKNKDIVQTLGDALNTIFVPATDSATDSTNNFAASGMKLKDILDSTLEASLRITQGFIGVSRLAGNVSLRFLDLVVAGGYAINVIDRLSGGSGHAADEMIDWARDMKNQTREQLARLADDARSTQRAIDRLHGKNVNITGTTSLNFTKTFTRTDWLSARLAAGRMAQGGKITRGTGPTADDVLLWGSKGEAMVPARSASKPEFKAWAAAEGIPGFALGGKIDQTGTAHTGVGKLMDRWGTVRLAALIKSLVGGAGSAAIKAFIRSTDPLPYRWGGAGPGAYDCSGITGAVALAMRGKPYGHGQRVWTTSTIRPGILGLKTGLGGTLQIGVTAGTGHMAGRYGGLGFEAESTRTGIKTGAAASRPESFARHFHLAKGGVVDERLIELFARSGADIGGDQGRLRINGQMFAKGGYLDPRTFSYAKHLLQRIRSGARVYEDFTWRGMPRSYGQWNDDVMRLVLPKIRGGYDFPRDLRKVGPILGSLIHRSGFHARPRRLTGWQLERLPDLQRWAYVDRYGRPLAPAGQRWLEDHTLRPLSDYRPKVLDRGGYLMPGQVGVNLTPKPERVVGPAETMTVNLATPTRRALARDIADALVAAGVGATYLDSRRAEQLLAGATLSNSRRR